MHYLSLEATRRRTFQSLSAAKPSQTGAPPSRSERTCYTQTAIYPAGYTSITWAYRTTYPEWYGTFS